MRDRPIDRGPFLRALAFVAVAGWLGACAAADPTISVRLDEADLQTRLDRAFPFDTTRARTRVVLENPDVIFEAERDRIGLSLDVRVDPPFMDERSGGVTVMGSPRYERADAALYLDELVISELRLGDLGPENAERIRVVVEPVVRRALQFFPIYRLERRSVGEMAAEFVLRGVEVRDGRLQVELGLPRPASTADP